MNIKLKDHAFKETWVGMLAQYPQKPILWQLNDQVCTRQNDSSEVLFTDTCVDLFDFFSFFNQRVLWRKDWNLFCLAW